MIVLAAGCGDDETSATGDGSTSDDGTTSTSTSTSTFTSTSTSASTSTSTSTSTSSGTGTETETETETDSGDDTTSGTGTETDGGGPLACVDADLGGAVGDAVATGSTDGSGDDYIIGCAGGGGNDVVYTWTAPASGTYVFDTFGSSYDTAIAIVTADCVGDEVGCNDDASATPQSQLAISVTADTTLLIVVDGYGSDNGEFVLNIAELGSDCCFPHGTPDCDDATCSSTVCEIDEFCCAGAWDQICTNIAGVVCDACAGPGPCCAANGSPGCEDSVVQTCVCAVTPSCCDDDWTAACADAVEANACGTCQSDEGCVDGDLGSQTGLALATGTTVGASDDHASSCVPTGGPDAIYTWTSPADGTYSLNTDGSAFDTGLAILFPDCVGDEWFCNDDSSFGVQSELLIPVDAGVTVLVVVDGYGATSGDYVLNIIPGPMGGDCCNPNGNGGCEDATCQSQVCTLDPTCCTGTWTQACADLAADNCSLCSDDCCQPHPMGGCENSLCASAVCAQNSGCCGVSWSQGCVDIASEVCGVCLPPGPCCFATGTPGCDDPDIAACVCAIDPTCCTDAWTPACAALADASCTNCPNPSTNCVDDDLGSALGAAVATGNTNNTQDDVFPPCTAPGGNDVLMSWTSPFPAVYVFDTEGSDFDNALALMFPECGSEIIACGAEFQNNTSTLSAFVGQGSTVLPIVDGFGATSGNFTLNVNPAPLSGFCCADNGTPGCATPACMGAVCDGDPGCCTASWDSTCASAALVVCDVCLPGEGDCCVANGSPGCEDQACQNTVCADDPFCCNVDWDGICVSGAETLCPLLCP